MNKLDLALRDPAQVFRHPQEVLASPEFSKEEKIEILRHWAYDQLEILVAEEENMQPMTNSDDSPLLDEILKALRVLDVTLPLKKESPIKQGDV